MALRSSQATQWSPEGHRPRMPPTPPPGGHVVLSPFAFILARSPHETHDRNRQADQYLEQQEASDPEHEGPDAQSASSATKANSITGSRSRPCRGELCLSTASAMSMAISPSKDVRVTADGGRRGSAASRESSRLREHASDGVSGRLGGHAVARIWRGPRTLCLEGPSECIRSKMFTDGMARFWVFGASDEAIGWLTIGSFHRPQCIRPGGFRAIVTGCSELVGCRSAPPRRLRRS